MEMYFIALVAPEEINQYALKWKLWMKEKYFCEVALKSPAHITLIPPFWMNAGLEAGLKDSLNEFASVQNNFIAQLKNFSHFGHRVIFIDIVSNGRLTNLHRALFLFLLDKNCYPLKADDRPFSPHITLAARDLHKRTFREAWEHFKAKGYEQEWEVQDVSLLKHNKKNWDVIFTSQFGKLS